MNTVQDAIISSIEKFETEDGNLVRPICFTNFIAGMAAVSVAMADSIQVTAFENENASLLEIMRTLVGFDTTSSIILFVHLSKFLDWYLQQEGVCDFDSGVVWYGEKYIYEKYEEYIKNKLYE